MTSPRRTLKALRSATVSGSGLSDAAWLRERCARCSSWLGLVLSQHVREMSLVPVESAVQEFSAASADPPLHDRVRAGSLHRAGNTCRRGPSVGCGPAGHPRTRGMAEYADPPGGVLDHGQDIGSRPVEQADVEEVGSEDGMCLGAQELGPGRTGPARAGSSPAFFRASHTVVGARRMPMPVSSPWMRR